MKDVCFFVVYPNLDGYQSHYFQSGKLRKGELRKRSKEVIG